MFPIYVLQREQSRDVTFDYSIPQFYTSYTHTNMKAQFTF